MISESWILNAEIFSDLHEGFTPTAFSNNTIKGTGVNILWRRNAK